MNPELHSPTFWTQFTLAVIGIGGLAAALKTLRIMERQTRAAEIAADAAKISADTGVEALQLTQRADVLLDRVQLDMGETPRGAAGARVVLAFKNFGPTRAEAVLIQVGLITPSIPDEARPAVGPITLGPTDTQENRIAAVRRMDASGDRRADSFGTDLASVLQRNYLSGRVRKRAFYER